MPRSEIKAPEGEAEAGQISSVPAQRTKSDKGKFAGKKLYRAAELEAAYELGIKVGEMLAINSPRLAEA